MSAREKSQKSTSMKDSALTLKLDRARDYLLTRCPFYGSLAMHLADTLTDSPEVPTACTDGRGIKWNRSFLAALTDEETRFVVAHEVLHCAHGHLWRLPMDKTGNLAADYEVNETLAPIPGLSLPKCAAALPGVFPGMACEEIYAALAANPPPDDGSAGGPGDFSASADPEPAPGDPSPLPLRDKWEAALQSAAQAAAAGAGDIPGDMQRLLNERARVRVDWRAELAQFIRSAAGDRADWSRSARRMATAPVIYPRRRRDRLNTIAVVRDTSGSIDGPILSAFNSAVASLMEETGTDILLIDADSAVAAVHEIPAGCHFPETAAGGGGTDFRPAFAEIRRRQGSGETFAGLIYLTDLDGPEPSPEDVTVETLWLCINSNTAATGRTVRIEPETY